MRATPPAGLVASKEVCWVVVTLVEPDLPLVVAVLVILPVSFAVPVVVWEPIGPSVIVPLVLSSDLLSVAVAEVLSCVEVGCAESVESADVRMYS